MSDKKSVLKQLQTIPSIGKACANDLYLLGIRSPSDLHGRNPASLFADLSRITGISQDICMLYTFRCAVYYCTEANPDPQKLKWWYWKNHAYRDSAE